MYENMILSGRILRFSEIDSPVVSKTYWKYKKEYIYIYIYICKTTFSKLIFHLQLSNRLADALLQEFFIYSTYVIYLCV